MEPVNGAMHETQRLYTQWLANVSLATSVRWYCILPCSITIILALLLKIVYDDVTLM